MPCSLSPSPAEEVQVEREVLIDSEGANLFKNVNGGGACRGVREDEGEEVGRGDGGEGGGQHGGEVGQGGRAEQEGLQGGGGRDQVWGRHKVEKETV